MKTYIDLVSAAKPQVRLIATNEAELALAQADVVIDVREESEYADGHLPGALHMSRGVIEGRLSANPDYLRPDLRIVLYCRTDARASLAAVSLQSMGYTHVQVLMGGFDAWSTSGKPLMKPYLRQS